MIDVLPITHAHLCAMRIFARGINNKHANQSAMSLIGGRVDSNQLLEDGIVGQRYGATERDSSGHI